MIEINNLTNFSVDKALFLGVAKKVLKGENKEMEDVSIAFVSPQEIQKMNKECRKKDKPTDVLSFEKGDDFKNDHLEVVICPEAVKQKHPNTLLQEELVKSLIHGILHSLGYDHEISREEQERMEAKEKQYFENVV